MSAYNLGHVTAYGYAKSKGYSGTEEEYAQFMADYVQSAETAVNAANDAEGYKNAAAGSASTAADEAADALAYKNAAVEAAADTATAAAEVLMYKGSPLIAETVSDMEDDEHVYVYTGSETGYTAGNWYYFDGNDWVSGGVYNSSAVQTDKTLAVEDMAADAAAVGDLKSAFKAGKNYNILPFPFAAYDRTVNSKFSYKFAGNGVIRVTGTGSLSSYNEQNLVPYSYNFVLPAGTYRLSGGTNLVRIRAYYRTPGSSSNEGNYTTGSDGKVVFTFADQKEVNIALRTITDTNMPDGGVTVYPMLVAGDITLPYVSPAYSAENLHMRDAGLKYENLIRFPYLSSSYTRGELSGVVNSNGSITMDGTASGSGNSNFYINDSDYYTTLDPGTYVLSGASANILLVMHYMGVSENAWSNSVLSGTGAIVFSFTERTKVRLSVRVEEGTTLDNETVYPMLEIGQEPHAYIPPAWARKMLANQMADIQANGLIYRGLATSKLTQSTRTVEQYDDESEQYIEVEITSYWLDELLDTGIYNLRTTESKNIYDLPAEAQGTASQLTVVQISDRALQKLEATTGLWYRYVFLPGGTIRKWHAIGGGSSADESLPEHWSETLPGKLLNIQKSQEDSGLTGDSFMFFTDYHFRYNAKRSPAIMARIIDACGIDKVFFGGDLINHFTPTDVGDVITEISDSMDTISVRSHLYALDGNHEHHKQAEPEYDPGHAVLYSMLAKRQEKNIGWINSYGDYWVDNPVQKIRYFMVGCESDNLISSAASASVVSELDNVPDGYTVLLMTHWALNAQSAIIASQPLIDILDKLQDLVDGGSVKVAGVLSGHIHRDRANVTNYSFPVIATLTDAYGKSSETEMIAGTITEQAFDVVILDTAERTIKLIRIGAGENRTYSY